MQLRQLLSLYESRQVRNRQQKHCKQKCDSRRRQDHRDKRRQLDRKSHSDKKSISVRPGSFLVYGSEKHSGKDSSWNTRKQGDDQQQASYFGGKHIYRKNSLS